MRLGFVVYGSLSERSGGFRYDRKLVETLRERGHTVQVITIPWQSYGRCLLHNLSSRLRSRLSGFDVLMEDHLCHPSLIWLNHGLDVPVVSVVHHLRSDEPRAGWKNRGYRRVERNYFLTLDGAICNSETTRRSVLDLLDSNDSNYLPTTVAYPAGDRFEPLPPVRRTFDGTLHLVFLGNLVPRKGLHVLLNGLSSVSGDWHLTVIGSSTDKEYANRMRRLRDDLGLRRNVSFTGRLPDEAVAGHLARSHVLTVPSLYEGFGLVYLEGMAFSLPAIATTAGGASEIVTDGENGFLLPPADPSAISEAVRTVRDDRDELGRMSTAARDRYDAQTGWDDATDAVERLLDTVIEHEPISTKP
ncbi:glycosyltransferase family 4 protein [Haladaptatus caseinilyticus]|uniref:glycosyltransferase family 4 protein n=1 Tax=Haladaptatus caseinilyticus TaxID=2993314 RepID=UPI00224B7597|nr:glycosyltransferase family 4 protein [Haladaptatus caseinilyticus]